MSVNYKGATPHISLIFTSLSTPPSNLTAMFATKTTPLFNQVHAQPCLHATTSLLLLSQTLDTLPFCLLANKQLYYLFFCSKI